MGFQAHFLTRSGKWGRNSFHFQWKKNRNVREQLVTVKALGVMWWSQNNKSLTGAIAFLSWYSQRIKEESIFGQKILTISGDIIIPSPPIWFIFLFFYFFYSNKEFTLLELSTIRYP